LDENGSTAQLYGIPGYPTTFIINKDGSIYSYIAGATTRENLWKIINKLIK
jgi:hypothetical protein